ncbi:MAG: chromosomal replication initiator protein DnaA [Actinomycetia bacterium]|nr:chromosomal replication initiator protein DnaA [Actinomycetes bacterium]
MNGDINIIWENILADIKSNINLPTYKTWFETITPRDFKKNTLTVSVSSVFAKEWLESRYLSLLNNSVKKAAGNKTTVKIIAHSPELSDDSFCPEVEADDNNNRKNNSYPASEGSVFNSKYTYDTFVVGNSNRFACTASLAISENPGKTYNPLFIYGGVGLGKTHLLHAVGQYTKQLFPDLIVKYVSAEKFLNDFINALRYKNIIAFKNSYRNNDILLVDDIQFLEEKEASQEEFFHTFNSLHDTNRQIVLSSDRPPKSIATLEERLCSRFEWGLVTDIKPPDLETRMAILRKYVEREKIKVSDDILGFISERITTNIRELEGALTRVVAFSSLTNSKPDLDIAKNILKDVLPDDVECKVSIQKIVKEVSRFFSIPINDILSAKRNKFISHARQLAMFLARELTSSSLPQIGKGIGGRDHTTVIYAVSKISDLITKDKNVYMQIQEITNRIKKSP